MSPSVDPVIKIVCCARGFIVFSPLSCTNDQGRREQRGRFAFAAASHLIIGSTFCFLTI
jgi:hypothetical protein